MTDPRSTPSIPASTIEEQVAELEEKLRELQGATRLLLTAQLVKDGHAPSWKAAVRMVREDFDGVKALYVGAEDDK